jgi:ketosteroid isomerase-like protein
MFPQIPQEWPSEFTKQLNAGDLEAVLALYEPEARFIARSGDTLVGHDRIRDVLAGLIRAKTNFQSKVVRAARSNAIEVLRRQPDGAWKLIVGDPNGRGR